MPTQMPSDQTAKWLGLPVTIQLERPEEERQARIRQRPLRHISTFEKRTFTYWETGDGFSSLFTAARSPHRVNMKPGLAGAGYRVF